MTTREVELSGGAPWGFRMHGGADQNQPLRISRVNPGRKASLGGIREGDVISSINGRPTKGISNAEAHAMLRSAGPMLRLGLNEDRDVSPRRRSIGKGSGLQRPSQMLTEIQSARVTPQAPVYATIRPARSPQNKPSESSPTKRASISSLPSLTSMPLVKSISHDETPKYHPTNPFYTTLPPNYPSSSKLPLPNGRQTPMSSLDRKKSVDIRYDAELKSPTYFRSNSGSSSLPYTHSNDPHNGPSRSCNEHNGRTLDDTNETRNPFQRKHINDLFEKYLRKENGRDGKFVTDGRTIPNSLSDSNFQSNEEVTERCTITEEKISEIEEIKTIKKVIFNGNGGGSEEQNGMELKIGSPLRHQSEFNFQSRPSPPKEHFFNSFNYEAQMGKMQLPETGSYFSNSFDKSNISRPDFFGDSRYLSSRDRQEPRDYQQKSAVEKQQDAVTTKPPTPVTSQHPAHTPTAPRPNKPIWRPGAPTPPPAPGPVPHSPAPPPPPPPPIWTPGSAGASPLAARKTFRPVHFEETPPSRRKFGSSDQNGHTSGSESEGRLRTSHSAPATGLHSLGSPGGRLPKVQNPTVTLLQKARDSQIPRSSGYHQQESDRLPRDRPSPPVGDPVHALRKEYASESEDKSDHERYTRTVKMETHKKVEGIGPTTKDGMPVTLRSEVKDPSKWYKKMYDTIHKNKDDDDYVTIRYKSRGRASQPQQRASNKSQYAYFDPRSGYLSEPEGGASRTWSDDRPGSALSPYMPHDKYSTLASARASQEVYKNQPGRIEDYVPGKSSVIEKETKQWWDEVMDIFDGWLDENAPLPPYSTLLARAIQKSKNMSSTTSLPQASPKERKDLTSNILSKSNMARALKESGYESDSTLVFRRRDTEAPLSPAEKRAAYRDLQAGGEPPLQGFRSPAPNRQDETEIEYIPISPTLTKIRIHKKSPQSHEVICYPVTKIRTDIPYRYKKSSFVDVSKEKDNRPAPPRRVSSKNSRTLKLVTATRLSSASPKRELQQPLSNVDYLRNKISNKLSRQNTQIILRKEPLKAFNNKAIKSRIMSLSAPPAVNRKNLTSVSKSSQGKVQCTSSFSSPRKTILPTEYNSYRNRDSHTPASVVIEGGAGRRTPITNILDKVTSLDRLWSAEKRNEQIDLEKAKSKSILKSHTYTPKINKTFSNVTVHKSRDMVRTAEKIQRSKFYNPVSKTLTKSNPCLNMKPESLKPASKSQNRISKSSTNLTTMRKQSQVKVAMVTNLKKKKSVENLAKFAVKPCHEICSKKSKNSKNTKDKTSSKLKNTKLTNDSESESQFGDAASVSSDRTKAFKNKPKLNSNDVLSTRDAVVTDNFFQHLFLGTSYRPETYISHIDPDVQTSVLQKAKMFQSNPQKYYTTKSLNSYLIHRKPVSLSRFKLWDRYPSPLRAQSPRSISWPGRKHSDIKKFDSLVSCKEFGSTSSLTSNRSKSEPPMNKLYFSQTSRPMSPTIVFHKKEKPYVLLPGRESPKRLIFSQTSRPVSPIVIRGAFKRSPTRSQSISPTRIVFTETVRPISPVIIKKQSFDPQFDKPDPHSQLKVPTTMYFSQTSRPVSPKEIKKKSKDSCSADKSRSASPASVRSPSYRRIHHVKTYNGKHGSMTSKDIVRTRSAGDTDRKCSFNSTGKTKSDQNLLSFDPEYEEYVNEMENSNIRSERFRELNRYYTYLERVAELEKVTSTNDLRHRKKDEEIIDFDRWKKIRSIERAEEELQSLYRKLKCAQIDRDVLFYPRDVNDFRWNHDRDRGLRIKEKSVEDLKEQFQQSSLFDVDSDQLKSIDTYKPLWRGTSVTEAAFNINRKNDLGRHELRVLAKPIDNLQKDSSLNEIQKKIGIGNRLWSSLSMEQVTALKNQLNAIYSKDIEAKSDKNHETYVVNVTPSSTVENSELHIRSSSLGTPINRNAVKTELTKSESIASIPCPITSVKELKNNVNKIQMSLSENEKKRISLSLSKEILNRINKLDTNNQLENKIIQHKTLKPPLSLAENISDEKTSVNNYKSSEEPTKIVELPEKTVNPNPSSASETDTTSSEVSNKTVIYRTPKKEVQKKVEYFESVRKASNHDKIVYHARESSDGSQEKDDVQKVIKETESQKQQLVQSQSCANFKELFGESAKSKFISLPNKPEISRSPSPRSDVHVSDCQALDTRHYSSDETIWRTRSPSPDPERCWRAYLNLARAGEVRRLARRFDSPSAAGAVLRRHRSDPELNRLTPINWDSIEKLTLPRIKSKSMIPVSRISLSPKNRYMPHIDVISKLASLRRRNSPRSRSVEDASECRVGEVEKIRRRFETMSLLGQIYTSAPDVSELRDIAPYLSGNWTAHRFPKRSDNNRSIKEPKNFVMGQQFPIKKELKRVLPKESLNLNSILKNEDDKGRKEFDPSLHRPVSRYQPPPPPRPPAAWPYRIAPIIMPSRHSVTFQENDNAPEPPRRAAIGSCSNSESPRRYVESDVNIHYKCPVRHDPLPLVPERELARQQAEHMKRLYREQKRNKYLQDNEVRAEDIDAFDSYIKELQDMQNRRHQDNFTPSQKTVVPLNRYDEAEKFVARALYSFNGQTHRELSFKKGDVIRVRRQIDANWYEGEVHGRIGLFPYNYVEIQKGDVTLTPKKPTTIEGRARAKFDFSAQTNLELPLKKGEIVIISRRVDQNWWEGRNANKTGIFPDSYIEVLQLPSQSKGVSEVQQINNTEKPVASPAAHGLLNGTAKKSMGNHSYMPQHNSQALSNAPPATQPLPGYVAKPAHSTLTPSERGYGPPKAPGVDLNNTEPLYIDTNAEAIPYRAMYKYRPQNPDELELSEGDTVYVLEKCDDGWYVGSSQRTGRFGTFPGNYVERI